MSMDFFWTNKPRTSRKEFFCTIQNVVSYIWVYSHIHICKLNNIDVWVNPHESTSALTIFIFQKLSVNITKDNKRKALQPLVQNIPNFTTDTLKKPKYTLTDITEIQLKQKKTQKLACDET